MNNAQSFRANMNGFYVSEKDHFPQQMGQFDCINDSPCNDTMGFSFSSISDAIGDAAEKLWVGAQEKGQEALVKEGTKLINGVLNVSPSTTQAGTTVQITGPTPPSIINTSYIDQPMDKNLKIALIAGGSLVGVLLLVTVIKGITK